MKTWHICIEDGPHQSYDIEVQATTLNHAITKALEQERKKYPHKHIIISPGACWETSSEIKAQQERRDARRELRKAEAEFKQAEKFLDEKRKLMVAAQHRLVQASSTT